MPRTVVLVGHADAGASALAAALVAAAVFRGTGTGEIEQLGLSTVADPDGVLQLLDATSTSPHQVRIALLAADVAVFVVAAGGGVDAPTIALWHAAAEEQLPRLVVVTGLDSPGADVTETVAIARRVFDEGVAATALPLDDDDGRPAGLLDLLAGTVSELRPGEPPVLRPAEPEHLALTDEAREQVVEAVLAATEDDGLLTAHLEGRALAASRLREELVEGVAAGWLHPALPVDTSGRHIPAVGAQEALALLLAVARPSPERTPVVTGPDGTPVEPLGADPDGPLLAGVLRSDDRHAGDCLVRVWSGALTSGLPVSVDGRVDVPGPEVTLADRSRLTAGEIGVVRLAAPPPTSTSGTGDDISSVVGATLSAIDGPLLVPAMSSPEGLPGGRDVPP